MWCIHKMEYHSALKVKETSSCAMIWVNLEVIILSKTSQSQKTNTVWFHFYKSKAAIFIKTENRIVATRSWHGVGKKGEMLFNGQRIQNCKMNKFWSLVE